MRGLTEFTNLPTIKEIPNITIFLTVLSMLIQLSKTIYYISYSDDKKLLREKIEKIFK
jgi:hypothetical protein